MESHRTRKTLSPQSSALVTQTSSVLLSESYAQALDLEWPHLEARLVAAYLNRPHCALQQIDLDRVGDRLAEHQRRLAALVMRLVQAHDQPIAIVRDFDRLDHDVIGRCREERGLRTED